MRLKLLTIGFMVDAESVLEEEGGTVGQKIEYGCASLLSLCWIVRDYGLCLAIVYEFIDFHS